VSRHYARTRAVQPRPARRPWPVRPGGRRHRPEL